MSGFSFFWYDYETFGVDPRRDRPAQFGGIRTDADFQPIGKPLHLYCKPPNDYLPDPEACLLTGITPQIALEQGVPEAEFMARINEAFSVPNTCVVGYNNIRFDDEVTRNGLYRNLMDPYAREYRNGNSRWDLIDLMRLARALRPEGIVWPTDANGRPSLKLDQLAPANGIAHDDAHDAVADVEATIAIARLLREKQPRLFEFIFTHRSKQEAERLLRSGQFEPVIHASEKFSAERHAIAIVVSLCADPGNPNGRVAYDLSVDPTPLLTLTPKELNDRLYTPASALPEGVERLPLKTIHLNKCPVLAPLKTLRPADAERLGIDLPRCLQHLERLKQAEGLSEKIRDILDMGDKKRGNEISDPDLMIYSGGFFSDEDKYWLAKVKTLPPQELAGFDPPFEDERLPEMLFRYRARNYPESLTADEKKFWNDYRYKRLTDPAYGANLTLKTYREKLAQLKADYADDPAKLYLIGRLDDYGEFLGSDFRGGVKLQG